MKNIFLFLIVVLTINFSFGIGKPENKNSISEYCVDFEDGLVPSAWQAAASQVNLSINETSKGEKEICIAVNSDNHTKGVTIDFPDYLDLTENHFLRFKARSEPATAAFTVVFMDYSGHLSEWINISLHSYESEYAIDLDSIFKNNNINKQYIRQIYLWPDYYEAYTGNIYINEFCINSDAAPKVLTSYTENFNDPALPYYWISDDRHLLSIENEELKINIKKTHGTQSLEINFADYYDISKNPYIKFKISSAPLSITYDPIEFMSVTVKDASGKYNNYEPKIITYQTDNYQTELLFDFSDRLNYDDQNEINISRINGVRFEFDKSYLWEGIVSIDDFRLGEAAIPLSINSYTENFESDEMPYFWISTPEIDLTIAGNTTNKELNMDINTTSKFNFLQINFADYLDLKEYPYIEFTASPSIKSNKFSISVANYGKPALNIFEDELNTEKKTYAIDFSDVEVGLNKEKITILRLYPDKNNIYTGNILLDNFKFGKAAMSDTIAVRRTQKQLKIIHNTFEYDGSSIIKNITNNIELIKTGGDQTIISWQSSSIDIVDNNGSTIQPNYLVGDKQLTLTATITKGDAKLTKKFTIIVPHLPITDYEAISEAVAATSSTIIPTEGTDTNLIEMVQNIINSVETAPEVTVNMSSDQALNHPAISANGDITYQVDASANIELTFARGTLIKTISYLVEVPEKASVSIPKVKSELPLELFPMQDVNTNLLTMLKEIGNNIRPDVKISINEIATSLQSNISQNGTITYNRENNGEIVFQLSKGELSDTITIKVVVPTSHNVLLSNAQTVIPETIYPKEGTDKNVIVMISEIINEISPGVIVTIENEISNSNIKTDGSIIYGKATNGNVIFTLSSGIEKNETTININIPTGADEQSVMDALGILPSSLSPMKGIHSNIIEMLKIFVNAVSENVEVSIPTKGADNNPNINENGDISYSNNQINGEVTFLLSKGNSNETIPILINLQPSDIETLSKQAFLIYPNPVKSNINLKHNNIKLVEIYNISGKKIIEIKNPTKSINISQLNKGIYFMHINSNDNKTSVFKFVKK